MPHPTIISESGRADRRLPQRCSSSTSSASRTSATSGRPTRPTDDMRAAAGRPASRPTAASARGTCSRATTTRSRRSTWRSTCSRGGYLLARAALHGREPVLGDLREAAEAGRRRWTTSPRSSQGLDAIALGHLLLQLLAVPVDARQLGHQAAVPDHADPPARRAADAARRARRHHLRLRRQDRPVHRSPRRQEDAAAAPVQRRRLLPRRVPGRRLPGDPRRPAQPASATPTPSTSASTAPTTSSSTRW